MRWPVLVGWLFAMVAIMIAFSVAAELTGGLTEHAVLRAAMYAGVGLTGAIVTLWLLGIATRDGRPVNLGTLDGLSVGLAIGLAVSFAAGSLLALGHGLEEAPWLGLRADRFVANLAPAALEEATMRAGVVHLLDAAIGPVAGLAGGSVPFGLLHLVSKLLGQPVSAAHVVGTTAAGLLLSLLYLRWGLGAAIGCHWIWNSLVGAWRDALGFDNAREVEAAWETTLVLVIACVLVAGARRRWWRDRLESA